MANGRMHHHDKYAAAKDGHRHDDPHGVTNGAYPRGFLWREQQADAMEADTAAGGIQHEGHEVFDENVDYGQRVTAFGDITDDYEDQMDEELDPNNPYAKKAMFGQEFPDAWSTDSPDRFSVPASKVHGSIGRDQIMIDASSTGGGETDSHLLNFTTTESSVKELQKGKWRAEGTRNVAGPKKGQVHWQMYPEG